MFTLFTLTLLCLAGVVLLVKALLDRPFQWESLLPALAAFAVAGLIRFLS